MVGRSPVLLAIVLAGCSGADDELVPSPAVLIDNADQVEGYEVLSGAGPVPLDGVVRAVNRYGAAVRDPGVATLQVGGTPTDVGFDGFGYGAVRVGTPGTVEVTGAAAPAVLHAYAAEWPGFGVHPAWAAPTPDEPGAALAVTNGAVVSSGDSLWWVGAGAPPHRVLKADAPLLGAVPGHVDVDGVLDVVAWSASTVFLLKGRPNGGFGWGAGFNAPDLSVASADVGDLSGDNLPDLAIAWVASDGTGVVDVWEGDGLFQFVAAEPRTMSVRPISLRVGDHTGDDLQQISVLRDDGTWARYIRGAELRYMPIGPTTPSSVILPRDARFVPSRDLDNDGAEELTIAGERVPGAGRKIWMFDIATDALECEAGDPEAQCLTEFLPLENEVGAHLAIDDGNGDGVGDTWLFHEDRTMYAVAYDPLELAGGEFQKLTIATLPVHGPFDLEDTDHDAQPDLFVAGGPWWRQWLGSSWQDLELFWTPRAFEWMVVQDQLLPMFAFTDLGSAPGVVTLAAEDGRTLLKVYRYDEPGAPATTIGLVEVDPQGTIPDDLALCGTDVYVVVAGEVARVSIADPTQPAEIARTGTTVSRVDCGAGPSGSSVAVLEGANVRLLSLPMLAEVGSVPSGGAQDLAIGDVGQGPEVATCATDDCDIAFWPYGAGGEAVFARADAAGITAIDGVGTETPIGGSGRLTVVDADGDGHLDLLSFSEADALLTLHRSTGASFGPAEPFHSERAIVGRVGAWDGDRDGWPDLWAVDRDGNLIHSRPPGVVVTTGTTSATGTTPTGTSTTPPDTGDTGDTGATTP